jgi:hypothetical protein
VLLLPAPQLPSLAVGSGANRCFFAARLADHVRRELACQQRAALIPPVFVRSSLKGSVHKVAVAVAEVTCPERTYILSLGSMQETHHGDRNLQLRRHVHPAHGLRLPYSGFRRQSASAASHEQRHRSDHADHTEAADSREDQVPGLESAHVGLRRSRCPRTPQGNDPASLALPCERRPHSDGWTSASAMRRLGPIHPGRLHGLRHVTKPQTKIIQCGSDALEVAGPAVAPSSREQ